MNPEASLEDLIDGVTLSLLIVVAAFFALQVAC